MKIDDLTVGEAKELAKMFGGKCDKFQGKGGWIIGQTYIIRTVTMINAGRLVGFDDHELWLEDAAWIADTGRYSNCLKDASVIKEAEPYPDGAVIPVGRGAIVDASPISYVVRSQK